jgi:hypothetical protein
MRSVGLIRTLGVALFGVTLLAVGCDASSGSGTSTSDDQAREPKTSKMEQASRKASSAKKNPQKTGPETTPPKTPDLPPESHEQQSSIPGMNADAVLTTVQKPGLECWQPADRGVLYVCSSEEDENLLYEAKIAGRSIDQVSGVEASVFRRGTEDFELASQPFLGHLATQLEYRGANRRQAYEFINRNLSSGKATTTIGAAKWTITTSDESKVLTLTPAY